LLFELSLTIWGIVRKIENLSKKTINADESRDGSIGKKLEKKWFTNRILNIEQLRKVYKIGRERVCKEEGGEEG
jgi:hypothetical protein